MEFLSFAFEKEQITNYKSKFVFLFSEGVFIELHISVIYILTGKHLWLPRQEKDAYSWPRVQPHLFCRLPVSCEFYLVVYNLVL